MTGVDLIITSSRYNRTVGQHVGMENGLKDTLDTEHIRADIQFADEVRLELLHLYFTSTNTRHSLLMHVQRY